MEFLMPESTGGNMANENGTLTVAKFLRSYWQLIVVIVAISGSLAVLRLKLMTLDSIADEVEVQSVADSIAVYDRWTTMVGVEYLICALRAHDSLPTDSHSAESCNIMLRFVPELTDELIPRQPNVRVWRKPNGHDKITH